VDGNVHPSTNEVNMIKFLKNFGVYILEFTFLLTIFGFAWFILVVFG
jgi:hypothetical protein